VSPTVTPTLPAVNGKAYSYPNPYVAGGGATLRIRFNPAARAQVDIYDWSGARVKSLDAAHIQASIGFADWNGDLGGGSMAAPGVYFLLIRTDAGDQTATFTVVWP
jgi:hypothetical protein